MDRSTPEACFSSAGAAMVAGDWDGVFACVATASLQGIASMVMALVPGDDAFVALCREHGIPADALADVRRAADAVTASAVAHPPSGSVPNDVLLEYSARHRELVKADVAARRAAVKQIPDLAAFVAASERHRRATGGGGSVSSTLFVDELLSDVVVDGRSATATRRHAGGHTERLRFVRQRDGWRVVFG